MSEQSKGAIEVKLFIILKGNKFPPIDIKIYEDHKPKTLISDNMIAPLGLPSSQIGAHRRLLSRRKEQFLNSETSYKSQHIKANDFLVLTDMNDVESILLLIPEPPTFMSILKEWIAKNWKWLIATILALAAILVPTINGK